MSLTKNAKRSNLPLDADNEDELSLSGDVERAILLGGASEADLLTLGIAVLLNVLLGTLEDDLALLLVGLRRRKLASIVFNWPHF